ncbi:hypothetical protein P22_0677 [Propionispora sp. 2/2-37]|uniref:DUF47 domain-containing protein n=1 Tax=Propionispora sp. 2/2-37 TaxID=1677858 RepID=UPI0006BB683D|nr:DUF47 family protein [Propionispora sp. 2/2-37]CUH94611.1 hypothetical protein P22_0677 [Propionispora sp. 2/2-37]
MGFRLKPKEEKFFQLLSEQAKLVQKSADILSLAMHEQDKIVELMGLIDSVEKEADNIVDKVTAKLQKTFITPFDREDIFTLTQKLDDVVDSIKGIIERMHLYNVGTTTTGVQGLTELVVKSAKQIEKAVSYLDDVKKSHLKLEARCSRLMELEAEGDRLYREEMGKLFRDCKDPIEIIKWKEILTNLEDVLDLSEDIADSLKKVVLKYA